jgi:protein associated with RNAse G/E
MLWQDGKDIALRCIFNQRVCYAQSVTVIQDTEQETALLLLPGAQCAATEGYFTWRSGDNSLGSRWDEMLKGDWKLREFPWKTNRFLLLFWPEKFYSIYLIWNQQSDELVCYYVNFQIPYQRSITGFDFFDLELDIVINPNFTWRWKDMEDYQDGIHAGCIRPEWVHGVELAQNEVFAMLEKRAYPFNGAWLDWKPSAVHAPARLPQGWNNVG